MPASPPPPGAPDVLVIEDDLDVGALLGAHLRRLGCRVRTAATGEEGLRVAAAEPPDVVLVDVMLPGIDGREVARTLRACSATSACRLVLTTVLDPQDLADVPLDAVLAKPFSRHDVARVLTSLDTGPDGRPAGPARAATDAPVRTSAGDASPALATPERA